MCVYYRAERKKEKTSGYIQKIWAPYTLPSYIQQLMLLREKPHIYVVVYDDTKPQENLLRMLHEPSERNRSDQSHVGSVPRAVTAGAILPLCESMNIYLLISMDFDNR